MFREAFVRESFDFDFMYDWILKKQALKQRIAANMRNQNAVKEQQKALVNSRANVSSLRRISPEKGLASNAQVATMNTTRKNQSPPPGSKQKNHAVIPHANNTLRPMQNSTLDTVHIGGPSLQLTDQKSKLASNFTPHTLNQSTG